MRPPPAVTTTGPLQAAPSGLPTTVGDYCIEVLGKTQCTPGRKVLIAPVPLHPVNEVLVARGDRVTKGQVLVKLDDDEAQADVRAKKAALDSASNTLKAMQRHLEKAQRLFTQGAFSERGYYEAEVAVLKAETEERAAKATLESAQAELEHYTVTAMMDGIVSWLDVYPGMVSRPGTTVWGEILDLSEIEVRCELTPAQADRVAMGQTAEIQIGERNGRTTGRVVWVSIAADKDTGRIPVVVRVANEKAIIRCGIPAQVRFIEALALAAERDKH
jgi:membrane fusion protein, multidrug efflux system